MPELYQTILADPPWLYDYPGGPGNKAPWRIESAERYPRMTLEEICALDVQSLAAPGAHLYLWVTLPILNRAFDVIEAWGFEKEPTTTITWGKPGPGLGRGWRSSTEFLIGARDRRRRPYLSTHPGTLVLAPRGAHSEKPEEFQNLIETMSPGPYLEMFARRQREGWDVWGNEVESTLELATVPA